MKRYCDLVVCAFKEQIDLFCERILPDVSHRHSVVSKLTCFLRYCVLPEILGRWYTQKVITWFQFCLFLQAGNCRHKPSMPHFYFSFILSENYKGQKGHKCLIELTRHALKLSGLLIPICPYCLSPSTFCNTSPVRQQIYAWHHYILYCFASFYIAMLLWSIIMWSQYNTMPYITFSEYLNQTSIPSH